MVPPECHQKLLKLNFDSNNFFNTEIREKERLSWPNQNFVRWMIVSL
jgi:hypothetical protein